MDAPSTAGRLLLPRDEHLGLGGQPSNAPALSNLTVSVPPKPHQPKSIIRTDQDWEHQKPNFLRLYVGEDLSLQEVMKRMEEEHNFKASKKQYNTKISQWRVGKNVKDHEMRAIVRKDRARKMENPPKDSVFRVRKNQVNSNKIARFIRDKGINDGDLVVLDAATPSDISCYTPRPENHEVLSPSAYTMLDVIPSIPTSPLQSMASHSLHSSSLNYRLDTSPARRITSARSAEDELLINIWLLDRALSFELAQVDAIAPSLSGFQSFESRNHESVSGSFSTKHFGSLLT